MRVIEEVWRRDGPRIRATLTRRLGGDLDLTEDALADALARAVEVWRADGIPENPGGWLVTTAWHRALDILRRDQTGRAKLALLTPPVPQEDDRLALIFGCCHPILDEPLQVALTLNVVCGLTSEDIAGAFVIPASTMAQRLVRAKKRLRQHHARFAIPEPEDYAARLSAVLTVIYLVCNEAYLQPHRRDLAVEALELARELTVLMPREPEVAGLTALIELQEARASARFTQSGRLILLGDQDRTKWNHELIASATARLDRAMSWRKPGPYQVQAAIAALHSAPTTDWAQIHALYSILHELTGNPLALLNRAVATRYGFCAQQALSEVEELTVRLGSYRLFHAMRGELLAELGRASESRKAVANALALATNPVERELLRERLAAR